MRSVDLDGRSVVELGTLLAQPSEELTRPCADPVDLPNGAMGSGQVKPLWGKDRKSLADCRDEKKALVNFYKTRDARLASKR